jgi:hypothetical protein
MKSSCGTAEYRMTAVAHGRGYARAAMLDRRGLGCLLVLALSVLACDARPAATPAVTTIATPPSPTSQPTAAPATVEPVPTAEDTGTAGTPACPLADLKASHGRVEGAAGSLNTEVVLVSATTCSVDAFPPLSLRDATGAALVSATSAGPGAIDLVAGVAYTSAARLANWCAPEPEFPLQLAIVLCGDELPVTGSAFPEEGDLPPCNGEGGPILEATGWNPAP